MVGKSMAVEKYKNRTFIFEITGGTAPEARAITKMFVNYNDPKVKLGITKKPRLCEFLLKFNVSKKKCKQKR